MIFTPKQTPKAKKRAMVLPPLTKTPVLLMRFTPKASQAVITATMGR